MSGTISTPASLLTQYPDNNSGAVLPAQGRNTIESLSALATSSIQTASYVFVLGDRGAMVEYNNTVAATFTIPLNIFPVYSLLYFGVVGLLAGGALLTIAGAAGVTLRNGGAGLTIGTQWRGGYARQRLLNEWVVVI